MGQLGADLVADAFDDFVFVEEIHFALCGMYVDVDTLWFNFEVNVDKWVASFGEEAGVCLLNCSLDGCGFDRAVVDEKKYGSSFDMVVCVRGKAR